MKIQFSNSILNKIIIIIKRAKQENQKEEEYVFEKRKIGRCLKNITVIVRKIVITQYIISGIKNTVKYV
jgi:hypothetical protein